ncbi:MAG: nucleotidyltransferase family protein [Caulobacteraceae bacterium]|nr:nucleotidyltransferase family protein [Caulobacteraceae bacterium]
MVLAAGLGTRMRPLTDDRPKALVEVGGEALIDHVLDRLVEAGVRRAVVNVHAFADQLEAHLRRRTDMEILFSNERAALMETGGGLKQARSLLGDAPILVANVDSVWTEGGAAALSRLIEAFDPARMDDLLLLVPVEKSLGFDGPGDFFIARDGALAHRGGADRAPLAYMGVHMLDPHIIDAWPAGRHGVFPHWMAMAERGRLHGVVADAVWMHVGDPAARDAADARLAARS